VLTERAREHRDDKLVQADSLVLCPLEKAPVERLRHSHQDAAAEPVVGRGLRHLVAVLDGGGDP